MKKISLGIVLSLLLALHFISPAHAAQGGLGIVTGPETGTYMAIGKDIAKIADREKLPVTLKPSSGSIENIRRIAESKGRLRLQGLRFDGRS